MGPVTIITGPVHPPGPDPAAAAPPDPSSFAVSAAAEDKTGGSGARSGGQNGQFRSSERRTKRAGSELGAEDKTGGSRAPVRPLEAGSAGAGGGLVTADSERLKADSERLTRNG